MSWLDEELLKRNWTRAELSRRARISQAALSRIYNGDRKPGPDVCLAIAEALNLPPEIVYRQAGLLPPKPDSEEIIEMTLHELGLMTDEDRREMLELARMRRRLSEERMNKK